MNFQFQKCFANVAKLGIRDLTDSNGPTTTQWVAAQRPGEAFSIHLKWPPGGDIFWFELRDNQKNVWQKFWVPRATEYYHIFLIQENALFEIREFDRHTAVMTRQMFVQFKDNPASHTNIVKFFGNVKSLTQVMPEIDVPYFSMGKKILPRPRSGMSIHNLRQLSLPEDHAPWSLVFRPSNTRIKFVHGLALKSTRRALAWLTEERLPGPEEETVELLQTGGGPAVQGCGECHEGRPPTDMAHVKAKLRKREWVGCQEGDRCRSNNYWFHVECTDIGRNVNLKQKSRGWICKTCRPHIVAGKLKYKKYIEKYPS